MVAEQGSGPREPAAAYDPARDSDRSLPRLPTELGLTISLALTAFVVTLGAVVSVAGGGQSVEWLLFLVSFGVILPGAVWLATRFAARLELALGEEQASLLAALLVGASALAVLLIRPIAAALDLGATPVTLGAGLLLVALHLLLIARTPATLARIIERRRRPWNPWAGAGVAFVLAPLAFLPPGSIRIGPLAVCLLLVVAATAVSVRVRRRSMPRSAGIALDAGAIVLILLTVPDLIVYATGGAGAPGLPGRAIQEHMNFLLGPANDVLGGRALLVDASSQYGIAPIYALVGAFAIVPIGYGTLALLNGLGVATAVVLTYAVLRMAGANRLLAAVTVALAIVVTVYNVEFPPAGFGQIGPLRFGLPLLVVAATTAAARWPERRRPLRLLAFLALGLASIWSLETLIYTATTLGMVLLIEAATSTGSPHARLRVLLLATATGAVACLTAHVLFAGVTVAATGDLPDWGMYLAYFEAYATGELSTLAGFDFSAFSLGLVVGAGYLLSLAALARLALRRDPAMIGAPALAVALAGSTGYGIAAFTYFVGRSPVFILPYVALPAFLVAGLWLQAALDRRSGASAPVRAAALVLTGWFVTLLLAGAWGEVGDLAKRTPLAHLAPGGGSVQAAVSRLWGSPPLDPRAPQAERLLEQGMPGTGPALVLLDPDLGTEVLLRSGRISHLPIGHPRQEDLIRDEVTPAIARTIDALPDGTRMLTQRSVLLADRPEDPLQQPVPLLQLGPPVPLQQWALQRIEDRFELRPTGIEAGDLIVVELSERAGEEAQADTP